jgi:tape measure domain-containing protein
MGQTLGFKLELTGQFAAALGPINKGLGDSAKHLKDNEDGAKAFEVELGKLGGKLGSLDLDKLFKGIGGGGFEGVFTLGISEGIGLLKEGFEAAWEIAKKIGETILDTGKDMIKAGAAAEGLKTSFDLLLGSGSEDFLKHMEEFAKSTPFTGPQLAESSRELINAGFKPGRQLDDMIAAAVDTSVALGNGLGGVQQAFSLFERVKSSGKIDARGLRSLAIEGDKYFANLGDLLHVSADQAKKLAQAGRVNKDTLISVINDEIAKKYGGALGIGSEKGAQTVATKLEKLKNLPEEYFRKIAETKGFASFENFLGKLLDKFDPDGPVGAKIIASLGVITDRILTTLDSIDIGSVIDDLTNGLMAVAGAFQAAWRVGAVFFDVMAKIGDTINAVIGPFQRLSELAGQLPGAFMGNSLGRNSVVRELSAAGGVGLPAFAEGGRVSGPTLAMIGEAGPEWVIPESRMGGGGGASIDVGGIHIAVTGGSGQEVGEAVAEQVEVVLHRVLDRARYALGVQGA